MSYSDQDENSPTAERFAMVMLATLLLSFGYLLYGANFETSYAGFAALFAVPFSIGALITISSGQRYSIVGCLLAPIILFAVIFPFVYFGLAEGLVCILMVLPPWLVAGLGGGLVAWLNHRHREQNEAVDAASRLGAIAWATIPLALMFAEQASPPQWEKETVSREVVIKASAEKLWPLLLSIPDISATEGQSNLTHNIIGIARPSDALLVQRNGQFVRKARWGDEIRFEEEIVKIEAGREIEWKFAFPDDSLQAYTDRHISPDGPLLKIDRGGYRIEQVSADTSKLTLWTTYRMRSRMGWYLELWGEQLLGDVEENVLQIVRQRAEILN